MTDALKLAEEALVNLHSFAQPHNRMTDEPWAWMEREYAEALAALRTARAEWGWKLLSDLGTDRTGLVTVGRWLDGKWVTQEFNCYADIIVNLGYTHYAVPQLPPPPAREEVWNG